MNTEAHSLTVYIFTVLLNFTLPSHMPLPLPYLTSPYLTIYLDLSLTSLYPQIYLFTFTLPYLTLPNHIPLPLLYLTLLNPIPHSPYLTLLHFTLTSPPSPFLLPSPSGGVDKGHRARVANLRPGSPAHRADALSVGDYILAVNGVRTHALTHSQVVSLLKNAGEKVDLEVEYEIPGSREYTWRNGWWLREVEVLGWIRVGTRSCSCGLCGFQLRTDRQMNKGSMDRDGQAT